MNKLLFSRFSFIPRFPIAFIVILFPPMQSLATLTPNFERGEKNIYFDSGNTPGLQEVCVIPKHYPGGKYKKKDLKKEQELCSFSFYEQNGPPQIPPQLTAALCPKENSTNPGVNVFEFSDNITKTQVEKLNCIAPKASSDPTKVIKIEKVGKYKNSASCSYAPSILAYYHVSRILGNIGGVPPSVLRTMDRKTHLALAKEAVSDTSAKPSELIHQTWLGLLSILTNGLQHPRKDLLLSDDGKQSYGAFIANPKKEAVYKEMFNGGIDRAATFRDKNEFFKLAKNPKPLSEVVSNQWNATNVQALFAMRDSTEFILLDHLLNQQDRFGNIAFKYQTAFMVQNDEDPSHLSLEVKSALEPQVKPLKPGLVVKTMILKDNDCGVTKENKILKAGLLALVRHLKPSTYQRLLRFQKNLPENKDFFTKNLFFTERDYVSLRTNLDDAVNILQTNCRKNLLKLDLDIEEYLDTGAVTPGSCELEESN